MAPWKRTLYTAWFTQIITMSGFGMVLQFLPLRIQQLNGLEVGPAAKWAGWASFAAGMAMTVFSPIWGNLADRFGRKLMVLRATFGGAAVMTLMGFAWNAEGIIFCRFLQGIFTGSITANVTLVSSVTPNRYSGYAMGMMYGAVQSGILIGPFLGGLLIDRFSFTTSCVVAGLLMACSGTMVLLWAEERFTPEPPEERETIFRGYRRLLSVRGLAILMLVPFLVSFGRSMAMPVFQFLIAEMSELAQDGGGFSGFIYDVAVRAVQRSPEEAVGPRGVVNMLTGVMMSSAGLATALGAILFGRLGDRLGHRKVLVFCGIAGGVIMLLHTFAGSLGTLLELRIGMGLASAGLIPSANALIRRAVGKSQVGKAYGLSGSMNSMGFGFGPLIGGYIAEMSGIRIPFLSSGLAMITIAFFIALLIRRPHMLHENTDDEDEE